MAEFLTTKGSLARIEQVITSAERQLHLISPFVQVTDLHARRLHDAARRGVVITLVCRYNDLKAEERRFFRDLDTSRVFDDPDLHAKCFLNERGAVLTSLNLYGASEKNNEMGVWLDAVADREAYTAAAGEAESIREFAREIRRTAAPPEKRIDWLRAEPTANRRKSRQGACIRCGIPVPFDPSRPYCAKCYMEWAKWGNPFYEDRCCHGCGRPDGGYTLEKPQCRECYYETAAA